jgi:biopolymer transport protein ExbB
MKWDGRGTRVQPGGLAVSVCALVLVGAGWVMAQQPAPTGSAPAPASAPGSAPASTPAAAPAAPKATAPAAGVNTATGELPTFWYLFNTSPIINSIILGLSVVATLLFIYFISTITPGSLAPQSFVDDVTKLVINNQYKDAADVCRSRHSLFIASIVQRCVENAGKEHSVIMEMLDAEGRRRADIMWNRISYLADVSNVAPMLGLLGTVVGMMKAFFTAQYQSLTVSSSVLTQGIAQAMSTTMYGLVVAIGALVFYSIVKSRATKSLAEAEHAVHSIADHIKRGR